MTVRYPDLSDYLAITAELTGLDIKVLVASTKLDLADSALHAPSASFGGEEFYPDFCEKAGVLLVRLAKNHPLLDGNKRAAWVTLRYFLELNSWLCSKTPSVDEAEQFVLGVADGTVDEEHAAAWIHERVDPL